MPFIQLQMVLSLHMTTTLMSLAPEGGQNQCHLQVLCSVREIGEHVSLHA
jgi:hypothetical protein